MSFPVNRLRRLRRNPVLRNMIREFQLSLDNLVMPLFIVEDLEKAEQITSMPGCYRLPLSQAAIECETLLNAGIQSVILFGIPAQKDNQGSSAWAEDGIVQRAVQEIKTRCPDMLVITDVCLCEYTSHGHCGVIRDHDVDNDPTLELLAQTALSHAQAGSDMVAPSDMMDGRIQVIRQTLDSHGFAHLPIMSYAAKYASAFYGPFRDAAESTPQFGDRKTYQMDPANSREALREIALDVEEGADIIMVKPAMAFMDIICKAKKAFNMPIAAYNVSGEYAMVKAAAAKGWIDEKRIVMELLTGIKRAGADIIITYHSKDVASWINKIP